MNHPQINTKLFLLNEEDSEFNNIFSSIKKKLQIKKSRKSQIDSLLKKCKGKFFKLVQEILNACLNIIIKRLPQFFLTNVTKKYNLNYLDKTIIEIYREFNLISDFETLEAQNLIKKDKALLFHEFCSYDFKSLYGEYLKSQKYKRDLADVQRKDGKRLGIVYEFVSKNFIVYYYNKNQKTEHNEKNEQNE